MPDFPIAGERQTASIDYPDLFPYTRFEVSTQPNVRLRKHQNPYGGNLCLLDRSTRAWSIDDTAAALLRTQLPKIEKSNETPLAGAAVEIPQAEPVTAYFGGVDEAVVIVPEDAYQVPPQPEGLFTVSFLLDRDRPRGVITELNGRNMGEDIRVALGANRDVRGRWIRLKEPPPTTAAAELAGWLDSAGLRLDVRGGGDVAFMGLVFPEETVYGGEPEDAWLFWMARQRGRRKDYSIIRAERAGSEQQTSRMPERIDLSTRKVGLVGLGSLGAPIAHLLMQAGVGHLRLVDFDSVGIGNAVRWPLGVAAVGRRKANVLVEFARTNYPGTSCEAVHWRIGQSALDARGADENALLEKTLDGLDLVVDATAELGIQLLLTDYTRAWDIPCVIAEAREGAAGGLVAAFPHKTGRSGCYNCLKLQQRDGRYVLPYDESGTVQPRGCADRTFTGAAFDLVPIAAVAAKVAALALAGNQARDSDVALLFNRDASGENTLPRWEYHSLPLHPECARCPTTS